MQRTTILRTRRERHLVIYISAIHFLLRSWRFFLDSWTLLLHLYNKDQIAFTVMRSQFVYHSSYIRHSMRCSAMVPLSSNTHHISDTTDYLRARATSRKSTQQRHVHHHQRPLTPTVVQPLFLAQQLALPYLDSLPHRLSSISPLTYFSPSKIA
jgi:hypothetical protein